jgi:hypothetical protein
MAANIGPLKIFQHGPPKNQVIFFTKKMKNIYKKQSIDLN